MIIQGIDLSAGQSITPHVSGVVTLLYEDHLEKYPSTAASNNSIGPCYIESEYSIVLYICCVGPLPRSAFALGTLFPSRVLLC